MLDVEFLTINVRVARETSAGRRNRSVSRIPPTSVPIAALRFKLAFVDDDGVTLQSYVQLNELCSFRCRWLFEGKLVKDKQAFNIQWAVPEKRPHAMQQFGGNRMTQWLIRATNPEQCFNFSLSASNGKVWSDFHRSRSSFVPSPLRNVIYDFRLSLRYTSVDLIWARTCVWLATTAQGNETLLFFVHRFHAIMWSAENAGRSTERYVTFIFFPLTRKFGDARRRAFRKVERRERWKEESDISDFVANICVGNNNFSINERWESKDTIADCFLGFEQSNECVT